MADTPAWKPPADSSSAGGLVGAAHDGQSTVGAVPQPLIAQLPTTVVFSHGHGRRVDNTSMGAGAGGTCLPAPLVLLPSLATARLSPLAAPAATVGSLPTEPLGVAAPPPPPSTPPPPPPPPPLPLPAAVAAVEAPSGWAPHQPRQAGGGFPSFRGGRLPPPVAGGHPPPTGRRSGASVWSSASQPAYPTPHDADEFGTVRFLPASPYAQSAGTLPNGGFLGGAAGGVDGRVFTLSPTHLTSSPPGHFATHRVEQLGRPASMGDIGQVGGGGGSGSGGGDATTMGDGIGGGGGTFPSPAGRASPARSVDQVAADERFRCQECGRCFSQRYNLNRHRRVVHLKQRPFSCPLCPTVWQQRDHLKKHLRVMHDACQPRVCNGCGRKFRAVDTLAAHTRVCDGRGVHHDAYQGGGGGPGPGGGGAPAPAAASAVPAVAGGGAPPRAPAWPGRERHASSVCSSVAIPPVRECVYSGDDGCWPALPTLFSRVAAPDGRVARGGMIVCVFSFSCLFVCRLDSFCKKK
ncbi:hypothetical protein BU14_0130s0004 [Porphyra umbilicalis]|uniref:C2H2-type domain-containing protein n=1 Tax=Porphyra umbilicalis TaxID=2786 RepID=A0A1X6PAA9_PORUM|nr:hypothetical protein BU14_0130s0004 [Porphyra umbilicalis]|eukprot:OSX77849.1 hypothetical protein BU14_0130s0004 [Porphyra umbilicalis]